MAQDSGLCATCRWARQVTTARGSHFLRCGRSDADPTYARYPALPVLRCVGFEAGKASASTPPASDTVVAPPLVGQPMLVREGGRPMSDSLLNRIGGGQAVAHVIDRLYDHIEADPEVRAVFPKDMAVGRAKQKLFFAQWLGGEPLYTKQYGSPRLRQRHMAFAINSRRAERWLQHMSTAMRDCGVDRGAANEIIEALRPLAWHFVNQPAPTSAKQPGHSGGLGPPPPENS